MKQIKILVVDDHSLVRSGIISLINSDPEFQLVGEASNGHEAISISKKVHPDVVLLDLSMPDLSGIDTIEYLKKNNPNIKILILTMYDNEEYIYDVINKGASGYLTKNTNKEELILAIKTVMNGSRYFGSNLSNIIIRPFLNKRNEEEDNDSSIDILNFTKREEEILEGIAAGKTNFEIADELGISSKTVSTHKTNLLQKLKLSNTAELTKYAFALKVAQKKSS